MTEQQMNEFLNSKFMERVVLKLARYVKAVSDCKNARFASPDGIRGFLSKEVILEAMNAVLRDDQKMYELWCTEEEFRSELMGYIYDSIKQKHVQ